MKNNEYAIYQNIWDAAKEVSGVKLIAVNTYIKKEESLQINNLTFYLKIHGKITLNISKKKEGNSKDYSRN